MNEPWAPIFVFSRTVFSELQVLIPGLGKAEMNEYSAKTNSVNLWMRKALSKMW